MKTFLLLLTVFLLIVPTSFLQARIVEVRFGSLVQTIQVGIDSAAFGDTVLVAAGTYTGDGNRDLDFGGEATYLMSESGPESTIIDCEGSELHPHHGFYFHSGEDTTSVVRGFTIRNGYASFGGGFYCNASSPTITGNIIETNTSDRGGGIYCNNASPIITSNTIRENHTNGWRWGGGIFCSNSSPRITDNIIEENTSEYGAGICCINSSAPMISGNTIRLNSSMDHSGGGILCSSFSSPKITRNYIKGNSAYYGAGIRSSSSSPTISDNIIANNSATKGGGISCNSSSPRISNNTIVYNSAPRGSGIHCSVLSSPTVINTIVWSNTRGQQIYIGSYEYPSTLTIRYSNVKGGRDSVTVEELCDLDWGEGMITEFPVFKNDSAHISISSPCRDAGDPDFIPDVGETDIDGDPRIVGGRVDMGADEWMVEIKPPEKAVEYFK